MTWVQDCAFETWLQTDLGDYLTTKEWKRLRKDCDGECGLCDCSTGSGMYPEHCSGHGYCDALCGERPSTKIDDQGKEYKEILKLPKKTKGKCTKARCVCYAGWKGNKCHIPGN